eukprot:4685655-Pyramimonas_sp.AAC.1
MADYCSVCDLSVVWTLRIERRAHFEPPHEHAFQVIRPMRSRKCGSLPHAVPERSQSVVSRHLVPRVLQLTVTGAYSL